MMMILRLHWAVWLALCICATASVVVLATVRPGKLQVDDGVSACVSELTGEALQTLSIEGIWPDESGALGDYVVRLRKPGTLRAREVRIVMGSELKKPFALRRVGHRSYEAEVPTAFFDRDADGGLAMCQAIMVYSMQAALRATDK